jgi:hypothetical protein
MCMGDGSCDQFVVLCVLYSSLVIGEERPWFVVLSKFIF